MIYKIKRVLFLWIIAIASSASVAGQVEAKQITFDEIRLSIMRGNLNLALQQMKTGADSQQLDEFQINLLQGLFFNTLGKPKEAIESFRALQATKATMPAIVHLGLAESLLLVGEKDEALINIKKALLAEPNSIAARLLKIKMFRDDYSAEQMLSAYEDAQRSSDYSEQVDLAFAKYLIERGESKATELVYEMRERRPQNALINEYWAQAQFMAGNYDDALAAFNIAAVQYENNADKYNARRIKDWINEYRKKAVKVEEDQYRSDVEAAVVSSEVQAADHAAMALLPPENDHGGDLAEAGTADNEAVKPFESAEVREPVVSAVEQKGGSIPLLSPQAVPDPIVIAEGSKVSMGSGFITNAGKWVITNRHVVENWKSVQVRNGLGERREANNIIYDRYLDLAIIELSEPYAETLSHKLAEIVDPKVGESVFVIGFPLAQIFGNQHPVISMGIVSSNYGYMESDSQFQVTAKMNPGNSGGPVFNKKGQVIGVAVAKLDKKAIEKASGKMPEDVNFALKGPNILDLAEYEVFNSSPQASAKLDAEEIYARKRPSVVVVVTETD